MRRLFADVWELRIPSGLRMYFTVMEDMLMFVEYGSKSTQARDINVAHRRVLELKDVD